MEVLRLGWGMGLRLETQVRQMWEAGREAVASVNQQSTCLVGLL